MAQKGNTQNPARINTLNMELGKIPPQAIELEEAVLGCDHCLKRMPFLKSLTSFHRIVFTRKNTRRSFRLFLISPQQQGH